jgi:hypothetical protein
MCTSTMRFADALAGERCASSCPDPTCTIPDCGGACLETEPCCPHCGATDPFRSAPECHVCRWVRGEIARAAEVAAGWDASP